MTEIIKAIENWWSCLTSTMQVIYFLLLILLFFPLVIVGALIILLCEYSARGGNTEKFYD